jgi:hypothetical protein
MSLLLRLLFIIAILFVITARLPAPISEVEEKSSPIATAPPKPKPKPLAKTKVADTAAQQTASVESAKERTKPLRPFAGTWRGNLDNADLTIVINTAESFATATISGSLQSPQNGSARVSGNTVSWHWMITTWTMTLNQDGRRAQINTDSLFGHLRGTVEKNGISQ